jgi:hypothetical protein
MPDNDNAAAPEPPEPGAVYHDAKGRWRRAPRPSGRRLLAAREVAPALLVFLRDHGLAGDVPTCDLPEYIAWHAAEAGIEVLPYEVLRPAIAAEPGVLELRPRIGNGARWAPLRRYLARRNLGHIDRPVVLRVPTHEDLAAQAELAAAAASRRKRRRGPAPEPEARPETRRLAA